MKKALFAAALLPLAALPSRAWSYDRAADPRNPSVAAGAVPDDGGELSEASVEASARRLAEMRRALREKKRLERRHTGAPNGFGLTMGATMMTAFSSSSLLSGGVFPTLGVEKSFSDRYSLKANYAWNGSDSMGIYNSGTQWKADLQIRSYPLDQGKLRGLFLAPSVEFVQTVYAWTVYHSGPPPYYYGYSEKFHEIGSAWGAGPVFGYQWVFGSAVLLNLENSYRYYWVNLPDTYAQSYSYTYGGQTQINASAWDFRANVGWAF